jgi:hypothetical protein
MSHWEWKVTVQTDAASGAYLANVYSRVITAESHTLWIHRAFLEVPASEGAPHPERDFQGILKLLAR